MHCFTCPNMYSFGLHVKLWEYSSPGNATKSLPPDQRVGTNRRHCQIHSTNHHRPVNSDVMRTIDKLVDRVEQDSIAILSLGLLMRCRSFTTPLILALVTMIIFMIA
jgi:hypothetical protein